MGNIKYGEKQCEQLIFVIRGLKTNLLGLPTIMALKLAARTDAVIDQKTQLISTKLPEYPWQEVGTDLFTFKNTIYLVVVDYFSRYPEIARLTSTTSHGIILALKKVFACHGILERVRSEIGPQYSSVEFAKFANLYGFDHITSSPIFPQSNG